MTRVCERIFYTGFVVSSTESKFALAPVWVRMCTCRLCFMLVLYPHPSQSQAKRRRGDLSRGAAVLTSDSVVASLTMSDPAEAEADIGA